jgi:hypothetical protein
MKKNYYWGKFGKEHPAFGHSFSEEGLTSLKEKGINQGIAHRNNLPKVIEINLDTFSYNMYSNPNKFLEKNDLQWNKVKYVFQRNYEYMQANKFPRMITPTYKNFWCSYWNQSINIASYLITMKDTIELLKRKKLFDELYRQEKTLLNQSIRFPITAKEALDNFYHTNVLFLIYKDKTKKEKRKLFLTFK